MVSHRLQSDLPAIHTVASPAVGSHLSPVYIGVTIGASRARVCKHQLGVALRATDIQVQALQRETCLIVIEFWDRTNYLPT